MKKMTLLTIALCTLVALGLSVSGSQAVEGPAGTPTPTVKAAELDFEFPLGLTANLLREATTCSTETVLFGDTLRYECPTGVPYCWRNQDCTSYCGGGGFEVCEFGCCACAG